MEITTKSRLRFPYINLAIITITLVAFISPTIGVFTSPVQKLIMIGSWYFYILIFENKGSFPKSFAVFLVFWWMYELILRILDISSASIGNYYSLLCFYDLVIKSIYILYNYNDKEKEFTFYLLYIFIIITIVESLFTYRIYGDELIRYLHNRSIFEDTGIKFVGTEFYNSLIFFIGILFYKYKVTNNRWKKWLSILGIILAYYFMLTIETRTTSLFCSLILLFTINYGTGLNNSKKLITIIAIFILLLSSQLWIPLLISIVPERVALRLSALFMGSGDDEGYLSRFALMKVDINTFFGSLTNFVFGVGDHRGSDKWGIIGQHSYFLDTLARYGIIGLTYLIIFCRKYWKSYNEAISDSLQKSFFISCFIMFLFLSVNSNTFDVTVGSTLFIMLSTSFNKKII